MATALWGGVQGGVASLGHGSNIPPSAQKVCFFRSKSTSGAPRSSPTHSRSTLIVKTHTFLNNTVHNSLNCPFSAKVAENGSKGASKSPRLPPRLLNIAQHGSRQLTTCLQEAPTPPQDGFKWSRSLPRRPPRGPKPSKTERKTMFLTFSPFSDGLLRP